MVCFNNSDRKILIHLQRQRVIFPRGNEINHSKGKCSWVTCIFLMLLILSFYFSDWIPKVMGPCWRKSPEQSEMRLSDHPYASYLGQFTGLWDKTDSATDSRCPIARVNFLKHIIYGGGNRLRCLGGLSLGRWFLIYIDFLGTDCKLVKWLAGDKKTRKIMHAYRAAQKLWRGLYPLCNHVGAWEIKILAGLSLRFLPPPRPPRLVPSKWALGGKGSLRWKEAKRKMRERDEKTAQRGLPVPQRGTGLSQKRERLF